MNFKIFIVIVARIALLPLKRPDTISDIAAPASNCGDSGQKQRLFPPGVNGSVRDERMPQTFVYQKRRIKTPQIAKLLAR